MALSSLVVDLILRAGGFESDMNRAAKNADRNSKRMQKSFQDAGKKIGVALSAGITVATTAIAVGVKSAIDAADEISKTSQKIGVTTESLSLLKLAADLSDVSFEKLKTGIVKLADGLDLNEKLFTAIGVSVKNTSGNFESADVIFSRVADVFKALPDGVEKTRVAVELFGRAGADLIPLLNQGSSGLADMQQKAQDLGIVIDSQTGKAAEEFNDTLTILGKQLQGMFLDVAKDLLPTMQELATTIASPQFRDGFAAIIKGAVDATIAVGKFLSETANVVRFVAESAAASVAGPALGDPVRQQAELARLEELRAFRIEKLGARVNSIGIKGLDDQIAKIKTIISLESEFGAKPAIAASAVEATASAPAQTGDDILARLRESRLAAEKEAAAKAKAAAAAKQKLADDREQATLDNARVAALDQFTRASEDLAASLQGPVAQANLQFAREQEQLTQLAKDGAISQEALGNALRDLETIRLAEVDAITSQRTQAELLLDDLQFEESLIAATSDERERAIVLRGLDAESVAKYGDEIAAANQRIIDSRDEINKLDAARGTASNFFADFAKNGISALDRLKDKITDLIFQQLGDQFAQSLFGQFGQSGGGSAGGIGSLLGGLFGGGSAKGNAFVSGSKVEAFANGGILNRTTAFGMSGGKVGIAGEAGPEAVLPLRRTPDGKLGVASSGGGGVTPKQYLRR